MADNFDFNGKDDFDLLEVFVKMLVEFKKSYTPEDTTATADDLAKFIIRWEGHLRKIAEDKRSNEVQRVLDQLARDREHFDEHLNEQYYDKKDLRLFFVILGVISVLASMLGPEAMSLLKYLISIAPK